LRRIAGSLAADAALVLFGLTFLVIPNETRSSTSGSNRVLIGEQFRGGRLYLALICIAVL